MDFRIVCVVEIRGVAYKVELVGTVTAKRYEVGALKSQRVACES